MEKECSEKGGGDTDVNVFAIGIDFGKLICLEVIEYLYICVCVRSLAMNGSGSRFVFRGSLGNMPQSRRLLRSKTLVNMGVRVNFEDR